MGCEATHAVKIEPIERRRMELWKWHGIWHFDDAEFEMVQWRNDYLEIIII